MDTDTIAHLLHYYYYYYYYYYYFLLLSIFGYEPIYKRTLKMLMFLSPFFLTVCPTALQGTNTGVIYSPSFPNNYPNNKNCRWTIGKYPYNNLVLNFTFFDLQAVGIRCYDKVIVREGRYTWLSTKLGEYCQGTKKTPFVVTPTGRYARVEFTSDYSITGKGFLMFYKFLYSAYTTTSPTTGSPTTKTPYARYTILPTYTTRGNS